jgi:hypothetical protein
MLMNWLNGRLRSAKASSIMLVVARFRSDSIAEAAEARPIFADALTSLFEH